MALAGHPTATRVKEAVGTSGMRGDAGMRQCQHGSHLCDRSSKRLPWPEGRDCDLFARLEGVGGGLSFSLQALIWERSCVWGGGLERKQEATD